MRIISGIYKGRNIKGFDIDGTRPTMNRVKESLFAMIQNEIKASTCLDLFAGSGNLGIEALSNGASHVTFVDKNPVAIKTIEENCKDLSIENKKILKMDYQAALQLFETEKKQFDLIFLDPPYKENRISAIVKTIYDHNLISENGKVICEFEEEKVEPYQFTIYKERHFGKKKIIILKK